jgi:ankyrin repeat protein
MTRCLIEELEELEMLSEMDPFVAAEEVGNKFLRTIRSRVRNANGDSKLWDQIVENIRKCPQEIIGTQNRTYSLLHAFADYRHDPAVELLLSKDPRGDTILSKAIARRDEDLTLRLLGAGATVSHQAKARAPLHIAAEAGSEKIVAMLLDWGADVNDTRAEFSYTPCISRPSTAMRI